MSFEVGLVSGDTRFVSRHASVQLQSRFQGRLWRHQFFHRDWSGRDGNQPYAPRCKAAYGSVAGGPRLGGCDDMQSDDFPGAIRRMLRAT